MSDRDDSSGGDGAGSAETAASGDEPTSGGELPEAVVEEARRLSRLAREAVDDGERAACERERDALVRKHAYEARVRKDDTGETLVLYPEEWVDDGTIARDEVEDTDRAVERSLSGPGDPERWSEVAEHNRAVAERVRAAHDEVHGETATALATFMSNHYAKRIEAATGDELREFREEYFPRNAWPSDEQARRLDRSIELVFEAVERPLPGMQDGGAERRE